MCGRFAQTMSLDKLSRIDIYDKVYGKHGVSYNVSPGHDASVVAAEKGRRILTRKRWGLIPSWSRDEKISYKLINAKSETIDRKPSFRDAYRSRRCLIPVSGFYEWYSTGRMKQPFFIHLTKTREDEFTPMLLAGLHESWKNSSGKVIDTFTVITTPSNRKISKIHHRMPAVIKPKEAEAWLFDSRADNFLKPIDDDAIDLYPVSIFVNSPENDSPECIEPAGKKLFSKKKADVIRELMQIPGVGKSLADSLYTAGVRSFDDLRGADAEELYCSLNRSSGTVHDRCVLYVFRCAVYFASYKNHDPELLKWWNWKDRPS